MDSLAPGVEEAWPTAGRAGKGSPWPLGSGPEAIASTPPPASPVCNSHGWLFCFLTATLSTRHSEPASVSLSQQGKG